ncbi:TetR family transcriptional regulator [Paenibacillus sp. CCS19]|uniref:TetR/AcrR family transcriptional regulator n=1 Tax=Paenibacillus sp. CCS19 TaxID=3158387 RepID=UPI002561A8C4|nr:TetR/AcrR family transcriptional regulator [Paenibacillus cellulosilyticus]GMK37721.1 TetR family transcriptional regulator [Paenibacillus cellulosilyticus]
MPPRAEMTKEVILDAAFQMVREQGLDVLTARNIAQRLKCSTQPIYSAYGSMEQLKDDVYSRTVHFAIDSMQQYRNESNASAMNLAIGCLMFARDEKQLFRTLLLSDYGTDYLKRNPDVMNEQMYAAFMQIDDGLASIPERNVQKMFLKLTAYWIGIGTMINTGTLALDIDEATEMLEEMFQALKEKEGLI